MQIMDLSEVHAGAQAQCAYSRAISSEIYRDTSPRPAIILIWLIPSTDYTPETLNRVFLSILSVRVVVTGFGMASEIWSWRNNFSLSRSPMISFRSKIHWLITRHSFGIEPIFTWILYCFLNFGKNVDEFSRNIALAGRC